MDAEMLDTAEVLLHSDDEMMMTAAAEDIEAPKDLEMGAQADLDSDFQMDPYEDAAVPTTDGDLSFEIDPSAPLASLPMTGAVSATTMFAPTSSPLPATFAPASPPQSAVPMQSSPMAKSVNSTASTSTFVLPSSASPVASFSNGLPATDASERTSAVPENHAPVDSAQPAALRAGQCRYRTG